MKAVRLLTAVLQVALCFGFYSCGENDSKSTIETAFLEYGITDYVNIELPYTSYDEQSRFFNLHPIPAINDELNKAYHNKVRFCGLKNNRLWIATFDRNSKQKLVEWTANKEFEKTIKIDLGYGEYKEATISKIQLIQTYSYRNNFVAAVDFEHKGVTYIFNTPTSTKELTQKEIGIQFNFIQEWYNDSFFIGNACCTFDGSVKYIAKKRAVGIPISQEEEIYANNPRITRYNLREDKFIWEFFISPPFNVPSDAKSIITLLDKSTNIWKYKIDYTFYDGTKKEYAFSINIDNGKVQ